MKMQNRFFLYKFILSILAWIVSMVILLCFHGCSYSFGDEETTLKQLRLLSLFANVETDTVPNKYLCVSVSYDRELVDFYDEFGLKKGNTDIASRKSLYSFLKQLENADYKAIALDITFDIPSDSVIDSLLTSQINMMRNIFIVAPSDGYFKKHIDSQKQVQSNYYINFNEGNFVKYIYQYDDEPRQSMALQIAVSAEPSLASNPERASAILPLTYVADQHYSTGGVLNWYNLSEDILMILSSDELKEMCKDKIILVGDYEDRDIHDTYVGPLPGTVIILNAIECYTKGICDYGFFSIIVIAILLYIICLCISFDVKTAICRYIHKKWIRLTLNIISITVILFIIQTIEFYFSNHFHDFTGIAFWLAIYCWICEKLYSGNLLKSKGL